MTQSIAIVGLACRYPDADSPAALWDNILSQRRSFRRLPASRLDLEGYYAPDPHAPDRTYSTQAAVLEGYEFDRLRFSISGDTYRATDLTHWLALDVAADALADAGCDGGRGLARERTGVLVGNTLTGEFSRASLLRTRWPYVERVVDASLAEEGWDPARRDEFLGRLETAYKAPFAPVGADTLAGGLSNTIAGRICNTFDFQGGGYTVDGACASSLLSVVKACSSLLSGDLDFALAGGVDLSLDPFELVGFAKAGALARDDMRVYDEDSAGFWPGEGCGFVALARLEDAIEAGMRVYATVSGWGVSSDGKGGITRPDVDGQLLCLERAYARAGFSAGSVPLIEGHGTGTPVGDATELEALTRARRTGERMLRPAAIGSIKANIGHTKAAAGVAGLMKATLALNARVLPPTTGCVTPNRLLGRPDACLRIARDAESWPADEPLRAGVSGMGFGGINAHVVLEGAKRSRRRGLGRRERRLAASHQDAEVFLLRARDAGTLRRVAEDLGRAAPQASIGELGDLAAHLARRFGGSSGSARAALVASKPVDLERAATSLVARIDAGDTLVMDPGAGVFLGYGTGARVGLLFPGQGSPARFDGGALGRRLEEVRDVFERAPLPAHAAGEDTAAVQPAIVVASVAGLAFLRLLGVEAEVAVGHSLGELVALHWAGAIDADGVVKLAVARGKAMSELADDNGGMAGVAAGIDEVEALLAGEKRIVVAGINGPQQTVVSGHVDGIDRVIARAAAAGLHARRLPVSHAFHSPLVAPAAAEIATYLEDVPFTPLRRRVVSTVTGRELEEQDDLRSLLVSQVESPVLFADAARRAAATVDVLVEVGPGRVLEGLVSAYIDVPVLSLDVAGPSLRPSLEVAAALYVAGAIPWPRPLFRGRVTRRIALESTRSFLTNPCETDAASSRRRRTAGTASLPAPAGARPDSPSTGTEPLADRVDLVRKLVARRAELPESAVHDDSSLLGDLHLNSITVAQIAAEAAQALGIAPPPEAPAFAGGTVAQLAASLAPEGATGPGRPAVPSGVAPWIRTFVPALVERKRQAATESTHCSWTLFVDPDHPLADQARRAFAGPPLEESGVVVCLAPDAVERQLPLLLDGARAARKADRILLVQHGGGGGAFVRCIRAEMPSVDVCVVDAPLDERWFEVARAEAEETRGYREVHYDASGVRKVPVLRGWTAPAAGDALSSEDVLLVTGGGKGIGVECALALAIDSGASVVLMGRSDPASDPELAENLRRVEDAGIRYAYARADVCDERATRQELRRVCAELGDVTVAVHAAGSNEPAPSHDLDEATVRRTIAPKVIGLRNVVRALDPGRLRLVVTFGSIIARMGVRGEAHYALANEWMDRHLSDLAATSSHTRFLNVEWSVWAGAGMGERLGAVSTLEAAGVAPIPVGRGVEVLRELLGTTPLPRSVVVTGRFGAPDTMELEGPAFPLGRFLERPSVYYAGIEVVADSELSADTDPYLRDHVLDGTTLLPAVMGMEAMAQAAMTVTGREVKPSLEDVELARPVTMPREGSRTVRVAALARRDGSVDVVLRSSETNFAVDHFRGRCRFDAPSDDVLRPLPQGDDAVALDPHSELYGSLLFQGPSFRRLERYRALGARSCTAEVQVRSDHEWFGRYLPPSLVLGDPGARDAFLHAVQACIPHVRVVPVRVGRVVTAIRAGAGTERHAQVVTVVASERSCTSDSYVYDIAVLDERGGVVERLESVTFRGVAAVPIDGLPAALLGPYVERTLGDATGIDVRVALERFPRGARVPRARSDEVIRRALGDDVPVRRRGDGKPEVAGTAAVSVSHFGDLTLAVAGPGELGCDIEGVATPQASSWAHVLGTDALAVAQAAQDATGEAFDTSATRVWTALESVKKAAGSARVPLVLDSVSRDGVVTMLAGDGRVATMTLEIGEERGPVVVGVHVGRARDGA